VSYLSLARKYRPKTFADLVGQESVGLALGNAIRLKREPRGVIFTGVRGIGKTTTARIYAKALNCEQGPRPEPCNVCASCLAIQHGSHEDVLEIDGASNTGVDDVRALQETLAYVPHRSTFKIYIIDEVHMLSVSAFNALLKTLEEPPEHVVFIFATTELHKVPETIQSRCQIFHLQKISTQLSKKRIADILTQEHIVFEERAIQWIAREGKGSLRDALTLLDQVIAIGDGSVHWAAVEPMVNTGHAEPIYELLKMLLQKNSIGILDVIARWDQEGLSMPILVEELVKACRNAFVLKTLQGQATELDLLDLEEREQQALKLLGQEAQLFDLNRIFRTFVKCLDDLRNSELDRFVVENYALEWCLDPGLPDLTSLFQGQGAAPQTAPSMSAPVISAAPSASAPNLSAPVVQAPKSESSANPPVDLRNRWKQTSGQMASPSPSPSTAAPSAQTQSLAPGSTAAASVSPNVSAPSPAPAPSASPSALMPKAELATSTIPSYASGPARVDPQPTLRPLGAPAQAAPSVAIRMEATQAASLPTQPGQQTATTPVAVTENSTLASSVQAAPRRVETNIEVAMESAVVPPATILPPAAETIEDKRPKVPSFAERMSQKSIEAKDREKEKDLSAASRIAQTKEMPASAQGATPAVPATPPPTPSSQGHFFAGPISPSPAVLPKDDSPANPNLPASSPKATAPSPSPSPATGKGTALWPASWKDFVDEWKKQKPLQARVLEETYSLEYGPDRIKLAVEAESLAGQKLLHIDTRKKLLVHFEQLFGFKGIFDVVPKNELTPSTDNEPEFRETLLETKQKIKAREREDLKTLLEDHPLTREAISAFDGTIEAIEVQ